ncbi:MAG: PAS domain S-box protein, partial [Planctomycetota bacterium]|nr:PAS domain S-box protein [Planctomycetota bacterium]
MVSDVVEAVPPLLQSVIDSLSDATALIDEGGTILAVNREWSSLLSGSNVDVSSNGIGAVYPNIFTDSGSLLEESGSSFIKGVQEVLNGGREEYCLEFSCGNAQKRRWFFVKITQLSDGGQVKAIVVQEDISPLKLADRSLSRAQAHFDREVAERDQQISESNESLEQQIQHREDVERALQHAKEYAENILESSLDVIVAVDNDRKIIEFNRAAEECFGHSREEVFGKHVQILYASGHEHEVIHRQTVLRGRLLTEIRNQKRNGEEFPCLLTSSILRDSEGNEIGVMGISRDITERKKAERALRESKEYARSILDSSLDIIVAVNN